MIYAEIISPRRLLWVSAGRPGCTSEITACRHDKLTRKLREAGLGAIADLGFVGPDDGGPDADPTVITGYKTARTDPAPPRPLTVRQVTGWLTRHPAALSAEDRASLNDDLARCPELDTAAGHIRDFGKMLTGRLGSTLPAWIDAVEASQLPGLTGFALHLRRDLDAVAAGLTLNWSSCSIGAP
ncbi:hypothetical protein [Streptomyces clavifer]|uniref:hypothetical protein n=1 Tax=Streptomyces clavifer TaxID=68188 RepID=UPI0036827B20